jgi:hypothetical protein
MLKLESQFESNIMPVPGSRSSPSNFDMALGTGTFLRSSVMEEVWKPVKGWEGQYSVSNTGKVKSYRSQVPNGRILKLSYGKSSVNITFHQGKKRISKKIHRLVLEMFIGPCPNGMQASHKDNNPTNNRIDNLCWATQSENLLNPGSKTYGECHWKTSLTLENVIRIIKMKNKGIRQVDIAKKFNVSEDVVCKIVNKKRWAWV